MIGSRSCYLPPCGGGRRCEASSGGGYHCKNHKSGVPPSPTLPRKGGGSRRERALEARKIVRGSRRVPPIGSLAKWLLHGGVGEPLAIEGNSVALFGFIAAVDEELGRVVAGVDSDAFGAARARELLQRLA